MDDLDTPLALGRAGTIDRRDLLKRAAGLGISVSAAGAVLSAPHVTEPAAAATSSDPVEIHYWTGWGGSELKDLEKIIEEGFNKKQSAIHVKTTTIFGAYDKLLAAIASGNSPDVVSAVWDTQIIALGAQGAIQPLDRYLKTSAVHASDYFPAIWKTLVWGGHVWGLPATTNTSFVGYNVDMFKAAGIRRPPQTLRELEAAAQKLTKIDSSGNIQVLGYAPASLLNWARIFGGNWLSADNTRITADNPKNIAAANWLKRYYAHYGVKRVDQFQAGFGDYWSPANPFFAGKLAMQDYGEWIEEFRRKYNPDLHYGIMPYPYPPGGRKMWTTFGGSMFCIPKNSPHPDAAWKFIEWITSEPTEEAIARVFTNPPPRVKAAADPALLRQLPILRFSLKLLHSPNAMGAVPIPVYQQLTSEIGMAEAAIIHGKVDATAAMVAINKKLQPQLDKFNKRKM